MASKKDKSFTFRISEEDKELLDKISKDYDISLSNFMRDAMRNYIFMFYLNPKLGNPQMIFSRNIVGKLFAKMTQEEIEEIVELAFGNAQQSFKNYEIVFGKELFEKFRYDSFAEYVEAAGKTVYSSNAQNWLDSFGYKKIKNGLNIVAVHELGENFSEFFKSLQTKHASKYGLELESYQFFKKDDPQAKSIKKDHIILKFKKKKE